MKHRHYLFLILGLILGACEIHDNDDKEYTSGSADFSTYVSIGNSISSGFMNGALYQDGQWASYPYQIYEQMKLAGAGSFKLPLMADNQGFGGKISVDLLNTSLSTYKGEINQNNYLNIWEQGPFNNMGVPGAKVADLNNPVMSNERAESFYKRMAEDYGTSTIMGDVMAQNPTFITLWIGANDALGFALRGGDVKDSPENAITTTEAFRSEYQKVLNSLGNTPGIVANLPDVSVLPYFDVANAMSLFFSVNLMEIDLTAEQAEQANSFIAAKEEALQNAGTPYSYGITFIDGKNAALVEDPSLTNLPEGFRFRQAISTDHFVLQLLGDYSSFGEEVKEKGLGTADASGLRPIANKYVLDANEIEQVSVAISAYNQIIDDLVSTKPNLHLLDIASTMEELKTGMKVGNFVFSTDYLTGTFFSFDGVHPSAEGSTIVANEFIGAINRIYGADLPEKSLLLNQ